MEVDDIRSGFTLPRNSIPLSLYDLAPLKGENEFTDHIPGFLEMWDSASRRRGQAARKEQEYVVKSFIEADEFKVIIPLESSISLLA